MRRWWRWGTRWLADARGLVVPLLLILVQLAPAAALAAEASVTITSKLDPATLTVAPGTAVTWTNSDSVRHRVRSETGPVEFDSGNLEPGQTFTFTFTAEGTHTYVDDRDDENTAYHGSVIVSATGTTEPPPPDSPPPPPAASGDVNIIDRRFSPASIEIAVGGSVTWANNDSEEHTVTATDISWDSGVFDTGGTFTRTFNTAGTFPYFCLIHPDMTGTVTVTGTGTEPPPPTPTEPPPPTPDPAPTPVTPTNSDVLIVDFAFEPSSLTVSAGSTVSWTNTGAALHTVTATNGSSDSGFLFSGDGYSKTFPSAQTFTYFCTLHPDMTGTITVTGSDGSAPPPATDSPPPASDPDPTDPAPAPVTGSGDVNIVDNAFGPSSITVPAGATVSWLNKGALPHTVTARNGTFDSGILSSGGRFSETFSTPGTFSYFCAIHPEMTGTVRVTDASGAVPPEEDTEGTGGLSSAAAAPSGPSSVAIIDNGYDPSSITVGVGQTITFTNTGQIPHTVTDRAGEFDSGILMTADAFRYTTTAVGTIRYFCTIHPEMSGTIIVSDDVAVTDDAVPPDGDEDTPTDVADTAGEGGADAPVTQSVQIIDLDYDPSVLTVEAGTAVQWRNVGDLPHTVTDRAGGFDSGILESGGTFVEEFAELGTFVYFCTLHPNMVGTVEVVEASPELASAVPVPRGPMSEAAPYVIAVGFVVAMGVFVVGLGRFIRMSEADQ